MTDPAFLEHVDGKCSYVFMYDYNNQYGILDVSAAESAILRKSPVIKL